MSKSRSKVRLAAAGLGILSLTAGAAANVKTTSQHPAGYPDVQASAPGPAVCYQTTPDQNQAAAQATTAARRGRGLAPVSANPVLAQAAAKHACDMARRGRMTHVGTSTKGPAQRVKAEGYAPHVTAENIAAGPFGLERVLNEWSASSGHRANILIPQVRHVGIGRALGSDGRTVFWAAVYGAPR